MELRESFFTKKRIVVGIVAMLLFLYVVPFIWLQSTYLSLKTARKTIVSMDYVVYDEEPLYGGIKSKKTIMREGNEKIFADFETENSYCSIIVWFHPKKTKEMLYIHFDDGSSLPCFVKNNQLGLSIGRVWVKNRRLSELVTRIGEINNEAK